MSLQESTLQRPTNQIRSGAGSFSTLQSSFGQVAVIIPIRNESENLKQVLVNLPQGLGAIIMVVIDGDHASVDIATRFAPGCRILRDNGQGKGHALRLGIGASELPFVLQLDGDGSMSPKEIPRIVAALLHGADIVKGSRNLPGGGSTDLTNFRVFGNRMFASFVNLLFGTTYTDLCYGLIGARRAVYDEIALESKGFNIEAEIVIKAHAHGFKVVEVPSFEEGRVHGKSHLHWLKDGFRIFGTITALFYRYRLRKEVLVRVGR